MAEELVLLDRYLDIEKARFGTRLEVVRRVPPALETCLVPTLMLQPVVENAIRHGIEPHARPGRVELSAQESGGMLTVMVADNGGGMPEGQPSREGVGLSNTRKRLEQLYGKRQRLWFSTTEGGGVKVTIELPVRRREANDPAPDHLLLTRDPANQD